MNAPRRRISSSAVAALAAVVVAALLPGVGSAAEPEGRVIAARTPIPGSYLVKLKDSRSVGQTASDLTRAHGGQLKSVYTAAGNGFLVRGLDEAKARRLAGHAAVAAVYQEGTARLAQDDATWGLDRIDQKNLPLDKKYNPPNTASLATAYVMDGGIRKTHTEFGGRASVGGDFTDSKPGDGSDCNGHGTHVAGTVGGKVYGVAKQVKVVALRTFGCGSTAPDSWAMDALEWLGRNGVKPAVVNMSLIFDTADFAADMIRNLTGQGLVFVAAAGNSNADACGYGPAKLPEVITVGNTERDDRRNSMSNYGRCVDVFAPGTYIDAASHSSDTGITQKTGTSMAAPHVAGAVAVWLHANPGATAKQAHDAIVNAATQGVVKNPGTRSPNKLLNVQFGPGDPGPGGPAAKFTASCAITAPSCAFDASVSTGATSYRWDFGDGGTGDGVKYKHNYAKAGAYKVKLTVTDSAGNSNSTEQEVTAGKPGGDPNLAPTASFSAQCWSGQCTFDAGGSKDPDGAIASYQWDFGDGGTGGDKVAKHPYPNKTADYISKLTVTDTGGLSAVTQRKIVCWSGLSSPMCFADSAASPSAEPFVRGGTDTTTAEYPWAVAILRPGSPHPQKLNCGGALVRPNKVITAAHCVDNSADNWQSKTIVFGRDDLKDASQGTTAKPIKRWIEPGYTPGKLDGSDVAVLTLDKNLGTQTLKVALGKDNGVIDKPGTDTTMLTYGNTDGGTGYQSHLQKAKFPIIDGKTCKDVGFTFNPQNQLCHGPHKGEVGSCRGDSGSPYIAGTSIGHLHARRHPLIRRLPMPGARHLHQNHQVLRRDPRRTRPRDPRRQGIHQRHRHDRPRSRPEGSHQHDRGQRTKR
ncbi:trypsin-like serine protease [Actinomadura sp. KC06]|uniref:S8 family serine peptidase n=1 Tax=Actinomadura sp. KC06 TaxID=2530369 RepID=UPI00104C9884|nr:S8 family serine peptidase [Actinomadura sp. KC06]TDD38148.1 trypsin-like serine protease [Actinomadura sp. KC06]